MRPSVYTNVLERAARILGGKDRLRDFLKVPATHLNMWLSGTVKPPTEIFLKVVDVVGQESLNRLSASYRKAELGLLAAQNAYEGAMASSKDALLWSARLLRESIQLSGVPKHEAHSVSEFMNRTFEVGEGGLVLQVALESAVAATDAQFGSMQLVEADGLRMVVQHGFPKPFLDFFACVRGEETSCAVAMRERSRVLVEDVASHPIYRGTPAGAALLEANIKAVQSTPLIGQSGDVLGVFSTHYDRPCRPDERDLEVIGHIGGRTAYWLDRTLHALASE
jgi:GAF domain-containing protein